MKKTDLHFVKITKEQSNELTTIVQEYETGDFISAKRFSVVDLWNIRRHGKAISIRKIATILS